MELVRTHDAVDLVPPAIRVEPDYGRPEAGDLQHHLGSVAEQELVVLSRLVVVPDVVEDGRIHMPLVVGEVAIPAPGAWVEVYSLGFFFAIRAALPGVQGSLVAGFFGRRPRFIEAPVAVHHELARDLGQPEVQERVDVELIPEYVPTVGLAVETAGWNASVQIRRVRGADLQYVGDVQANQELDPAILGDAHIADGPELVPGPGVMAEGLGEWFVATDGLYGVGQRLLYGVVARVVEGDHLLDAHRAILFDIKGQCLLDVVVRLVEVTTYTHHLVLPVNPGARRLGDVYVRLTSPRPQGDDVGSYRAGQVRFQVPTFELPVARDAPIHNPVVQRGDHRHRAGPVLRSDRPLDRP